MASLILVEGENDKYFIEALVKHLQVTKPTEVSEAYICNVDDVECLGGIGGIQASLAGIKGRIRKGGIERLGVIIDVDDKSKKERLALVNAAIKEVFGTDDNALKDIGVFEDVVVDVNQTIKVGCYLTNVEGKGELETVLRKIKGKASDYGDCLDAWRACLTRKGKEIDQKVFDKQWVQMYIRYDTCSKKESKQAMKKCCFEASLVKPGVWNLNHPCLSELKEFLLQFN